MEEIKFKNLFVDGTKIEAYANTYTFVWKKAVEKNFVKPEKKIENMLPAICERYGLVNGASLEDCYKTLVLQAHPLR